MSLIPKTVPLYYEDMQMYECSAKILSIQDSSDLKRPGFCAFVLDRTIFHPQGGGQPSDTGTIRGEGGAEFAVVHSHLERETDRILHIGQFVSGTLSVGDAVTVSIDPQKRILYSRLHSAGHLVDSCLASLGLQWRTTKGHHFPDAPYNEYCGEVEPEKIESIRTQLERRLEKCIEENTCVQTHQNVSPEKARLLCGELDPKYLEVPDLRIVTIAGFSCACGGTHVQSLGQLKGVKISKIKATKSKQLIKVSYGLCV